MELIRHVHRLLHKYSERGFAVALPGFNALLTNQKVLISSYIYIQDHNILLEIVQFGRPGTKEFVIEFARHQSKVQCQHSDRGRTIHGSLKLVILDRGLARPV